MKIFLTSNQQFGRNGAIDTYKRPFSSVNEMNFELIDRWNSVVSEDDTVYVLGNFAWDPESAELAVKALHGNIIFLNGEYDNAIEEIIEVIGSDDFSFLYNAIEEVPEANVVLSYWPLMDWPEKDKGTYSVIGYPDKKYQTNHKTKIINCACDFWDFKPIDITKTIELLISVGSQC